MSSGIEIPSAQGPLSRETLIAYSIITDHRSFLIHILGHILNYRTVALYDARPVLFEQIQLPREDIIELMGDFEVFCQEEVDLLYYQKEIGRFLEIHDYNARNRGDLNSLAFLLQDETLALFAFPYIHFPYGYEHLHRVWVAAEKKIYISMMLNPLGIATSPLLTLTLEEQENTLLAFGIRSGDLDSFTAEDPDARSNGALAPESDTKEA